MTTIDTPRPPHRLERLRAWMEEQDADAVVAAGPSNVTHLSGYLRYYGGPGAVVVGRDGRRTLAVMRDEAPVAQRLAEADEVVGYGEPGFGLDLDPVARLVETLRGLPVLARAKLVGVASELPGLEQRLGLSSGLVDAADAMVRLRLIKDEDELRKIHASYELCWLGQHAVAEASVPGAEEIEIFTAAQSAAQLEAGEPIDFLADLLSGPNTGSVCGPIYVPGRRAVVEGDPVIADVVVRWNGYWGDTAETHSVGSSEEADAARVELLAILAEAAGMLRPGTTGAEVFGHVDRRIRDAFPGGEFPHHGGHAVGLTSFEDPHLIPSDTMPFEPWMVLAVEPGVYFPGRFGARVENIFVVTPEGGVELREAMGDGRS